MTIDVVQLFAGLAGAFIVWRKPDLKGRWLLVAAFALFALAAFSPVENLLTLRWTS